MSDDGSECLTFDDRGARPGYRNEVLVALLVTAGLGVALRFVLAGNLTLPWNFAHLRHAHSHAGVYALLFPLCFVAWKQMGVVTLGRMVYAFYFAASAVAVVIFIRSGYVFLSIAGSTIVGGIWLLAAYRARSILRGESGAFRVMPLALLGATLFVPPIAIATPREPEFAQGLGPHFFGLSLFVGDGAYRVAPDRHRSSRRADICSECRSGGLPPRGHAEWSGGPGFGCTRSSSSDSRRPSECFARASLRMGRFRDGCGRRGRDARVAPRSPGGRSTLTCCWDHSFCRWSSQLRSGRGLDSQRRRRWEPRSARWRRPSRDHSYTSWRLLPACSG